MWIVERKYMKTFHLKKNTVSDSVELETNTSWEEYYGRTFLNNVPMLCCCLSHSSIACCSISDTLWWTVTWKGRNERCSSMKKGPQMHFPALFPWVLCTSWLQLLLFIFLTGGMPVFPNGSYCQEKVTSLGTGARNGSWGPPSPEWALPISY